MTFDDDLNYGETLRGLRQGMRVFNNRYALKRKLGRGGMGEVWLAEDTDLDREVAIKFLPEVIARDEAAVGDLKREARRALNLTHTNIVRVHDFLCDEYFAAISMEYIDGKSLAVMKTKAPEGIIEWKEIEGWLNMLFSALSYAHEEAKIVHRDLKPANILMTTDGVVKIADFGISSSITDTVSRVSVHASSSGTPVYMSPQQMMGDAPAVSDDIYSLGALFYELLTGKPPFYSGSIFLQVQNKVPPSLAERRAELQVSGEPIPALVESVIAACLQKKVEDRPKSIKELEALLSGEGINEKVSIEKSEAPHLQVETESQAPPDKVSVPKSSSTGPEEPKSRKAVWLGLVVLVAVVLGFGYFFGVYLPEKERKDELAHLEAEKLLREEKAQQSEEERLANARGGLIIRTEPAGAEVRIGGTMIRESPVNVADLKLGNYPIVILKEGYREKRLDLVVEEDAFTDPGVIELELITGSVSLDSDPSEAEVYQEDKLLGKTPLTLNSLKPGTHTFRVQSYNYRREDVTLTVKGDEVTEKRLSLEKVVGPKESHPWTVPDLGLEMVWIDPGDFIMGSPPSEFFRGDEPQHRVLISQGYWLGKYEVTQLEWKSLMGNMPSRFDSDENRFPVENVSWEDAINFCRTLTSRERRAGRLPSHLEYTLLTEAEWEYACRAGTTTPFHYGNRLDVNLANIKELNHRSKKEKVGSYKPNNWGLYDMHGNVMEWVMDWKGDYPSGTVTDPKGPSTSGHRMVRGGGFNIIAQYCRSAQRTSKSPTNRDYNLGFRLAIRNIQ